MELERQLKEIQSLLSPEKAIEIAESIYTVTVAVQGSNEKVSRMILITEEQKSLANLFEF